MFDIYFTRWDGSERRQSSPYPVGVSTFLEAVTVATSMTFALNDAAPAGTSYDIAKIEHRGLGGPWAQMGWQTLEERSAAHTEEEPSL